VASETKVVLDAFLRVVGDGDRGFLGCDLDCQFVAGVACFDVDCGSGIVGCCEQLQKMGC
jgi:hypothetical protein